ncbi:MAG: SdrD B-like domain-containing protein [Saprospiraceae bacterium]
MIKVAYLLLSLLICSFLPFRKFQALPKPITHRESTLEKSLPCELYIDKVIIGDCEYGIRTKNQSKLIVAVFLSWKNPILGEKIIVTLKGQTQIFDPFMKGCPPYVQFVLDPDGGQYLLKASFKVGACSAVPINVQLPNPCDPPVCAGTQSIGGKVFKYYNGNGIQESSETGLPGIEVRLYNDNKQLVASTITKTNGIWSIGNLIQGMKIRAEFQVPLGLYDSNPGLDNKTRTQKTIVGNCKVDLGLYQLNSIIDENPWCATAVFVKGNALDTTSPAFNRPAIVANLYNTTEGGPRVGPNGNYNLASAGEIGSVWGLSFQKESRKLYSTAFLKRNAALGPFGLGAIYVTDLNNFLPNPVPTPGYNYYGMTQLLLNLDDFGIKTGDEKKLIRDLSKDPNAASHDSIAFNLIAKWGLGDNDLNEIGDTLFVVNMYNKSLIQIAIGNPLILPITANRITEIPIPDPGCSATSDWRPWGLKYKNGKLFVGGVCSAESTGNKNDLNATIYSFENNLFTKVTSFDLNYTKGFLNDNYCSTFRPWSNDFYTYRINADIICGPVPVLSDIEFDSEDNMIVSIGDRYGYQTGGRDYGTDIKDGTIYLNFSGGDNLKLFKLKDEYLLEKNATSGFITTLGANNNQGICGGEFYYQDGFYTHQEGALGGLAAHPSYNTILATMMDPASIWSNGWSQLDNTIGTKNVNYNIFTGEQGTFGKAAGLGDIEILIGSSEPKGFGISIGNYIWEDSDGDGIQDPGENALANMPVLLFGKNDTLLKKTITDVDGLYLFQDLDSFTNYNIQIGEDVNYQGAQLIFNNLSYLPSKFRTKINFGNSENDSDASNYLPASPKFQNKIVLNYITGKAGENDFSLDFGLIPCSQIAPDTLNIQICKNDSIKVGDTWFSSNNLSSRVKFPIANKNGCDSILFIYASFRAEATSTLDTSICTGGTLKIHNQTFDQNNTSGTIHLSGSSQYGCDSIIAVNVKVLPFTKSNLDTSICKGGKITIHSQTFDESKQTGDITLSAANQFGCDSVISVKVSFLPFTKSFLDTSICKGGKITIHNQTFDESKQTGDITLSGANKFGCDSIVSVKLSFLPFTKSFLDTSVCNGGSIIIHNQTFNESNQTGDIILSGKNQFGCDSIIHIQLKFLPFSQSRLDTTICLGEKLILYNQTFDQNKKTGTIRLPGMNQFGCDSLIQVQLNFNTKSEKKIDTFICPGGQIIFENQILDEQHLIATKIISGGSQHGCDSFITLNLKIKPQYHYDEIINSCEEYTWPVNGITYKESGSFRIDLNTRDGCDSIYQLQLKIHPSYVFYDTLCALKKFIWPVNGRYYDKSGVYEVNHRSSFGCDSIQNLVLMIMHGSEVYVPNVFSPNNDGLNDKLTIFGNSEVTMINHFWLYDRWGELVFDQHYFPPNDPDHGWNGNFRGESPNPGVYAFLVEWTDKFGGRYKDYGDVTLVR